MQFQSSLLLQDKMRRFIHDMKHFILAEIATQKDEIARTWGKPLPSRINNGFAIDGIHIVERQQSGHLVIRCERNESRFREGDAIRVHRGDPFGNEPPFFDATIEVDDGLELTIYPQSLNPREIEAHPTGWIIDAGFFDLSQPIIEALNEAADTPAGHQQILPLLMHQREPEILPGKYEQGLELGESCGLNEEQTEAFANAFATDLAHLVQGPPGTGKTFVLANLAWALAHHEEERVLVTGLTHRAINNALNKIHAVAPNLPIVKIGQANQSNDLNEGISTYDYFDSSPLRELPSGYIVGATPFATRSNRLRGIEFETVIFDESSQIILPLAIMGMLSAKRYIFFGDHHQLPPVLTTRMTGGAFRGSVFERLVDGNMDTMLTATYRLNEALTAWPNRYFYDGMLTAVEPMRRLVYERDPTQYTKVLAADEPMIFWDIGTRNAATFSRREANAVVELLLELDRCGVAPEDIGVVVPYRAQARLIRNQLRGISAQPVPKQLVIDTVDRMQGQERDIVIVSLTTSSPAFAAQLADFFFKPQRLNVAVTRPTSKLIIIGSSHVLMARPDNPAQAAAVEMLADLLNSCGRVVYPDG